MAGGGGLEPPLPGPEPGVLPLDEPPAAGVIVRAAAAGCQGKAPAELARGLQQRVLQRAARLEPRHAARRDLDGLAGAGIAAVALGPAAHQEGSEAADGHLAASLERIEDPVEESVERLLSGDLGAAGGLRHRADQVRLDHEPLLLRERSGRSHALTRSTAWSRTCRVNGFERTGARMDSRTRHTSSLAVSPVMNTKRRASSFCCATAAR